MPYPLILGPYSFQTLQLYSEGSRINADEARLLNRLRTQALKQSPKLQRVRERIDDLERNHVLLSEAGEKDLQRQIDQVDQSFDLPIAEDRPAMNTLAMALQAYAEKEAISRALEQGDLLSPEEAAVAGAKLLEDEPLLRERARRQFAAQRFIAKQSLESLL